MEGPLFKWTNYVSGWQQRWFAVEGDTLSYYRSPDEVNDGCKGSVKLSACDVVVHSSDLKRFDLIIGNQRFYLRALSGADRKRWVAALGSRKMGALHGPSKHGIFSESQTKSIVAHQSELRMYHNLMVQQINELRSCLKEDTIPDMLRVNEVTSTLDAACLIFMATLNQLLVLTQSPEPSDVLTAASANSVNRSYLVPSSRSLSSLHFNDGSRSPSKFDPSPSCALGMSPLSLTPSVDGKRTTRLHSTFFSTMDFSFEDVRLDVTPAKPDKDTPRVPADGLSASDFEKACRSLFTLFDHCSVFTHHTDVPAGPAHTALRQVQENLQNSLDCLQQAIKDCAHSNLVFDSQTSITDEPLSKFDSPGVSQITVGTLIRNDLANNRLKDETSAYRAILSLGRSLNFTREFLHLLFTLSPPDDGSRHPLRTPDDSLSVIAAEAYYRCLRAHHQWSLRGVANIIIKSLPPRNTLLRALAVDFSGSTPTGVPSSDIGIIQTDLYAQLAVDAKLYSEALYRILTPIEDLFGRLNLERIFTGSESH